MKLTNKYEYKIPKIWFYEIKGVKDVATLQELEIAKNLSNLRASIFLETRAYIRKSLATLFNLDPLAIQINAKPGEPPELPLGMGNISISHCQDAIVIAWHEKKIGIDIERTDRKFNHIKLATKYFSKTNTSFNKNTLTKNMILNRWCATEAAIKLDHGKLARDIKDWQYIENNRQLIHKKKNLYLNFSKINFHKWTIALAYKEKFDLKPEIICSSKTF